MKKEKINKKEFKKDFNTETAILSNDDLLKKYGFDSIKEMCDYARNNNLIVLKELTKEEKENLDKLKNWLKETLKLL